MVPKGVFFVKGVGHHKNELQAFETALRSASIERCNLVYVSSILPPNCNIISKEEGITKLQPGQIVYVVLSRNSTNEPNRLIGSAIGMAVPKDGNSYGYISEHHAFGETKDRMEAIAMDLAASMLSSTLGIEVDQSISWNERKETIMSSGLIIKSHSIAQTAEGDKNGLWTVVLTAAVFVED